MNNDDRPTGWTDQRISAAYRARFDMQAPADLPGNVRAELAALGLGDQGSRPSQPFRRSFGYPLGTAAVFVVVLVVSLTLKGTAPGPSGSSTPLSTTTAVPRSGETRPVLSVTEALEIRDSTAGAREIVVGGWFTFNAVPCALIPGASALDNCAVNFTWLMAAPEQLHSLQSDGSGSIHPPVGPGFNVALAVVDSGIPSGDAPTYVTLVGHFHDPRADACPEGARRTHCENVFVADAVLETGAAR